MMTWSTGLELTPLKVEVDFAVWYRKESLGIEMEVDEPIFMIGEAKCFGRNAIKADDIETLKAVGERFPGAFLVFSVLKSAGEFSGDELTLLRGLANWGRADWPNGKPRNPVIVLTGLELLSDRHISQIWEKEGGKAASLVKHPSTSLDDPYTLSELTQQLYLDLPSLYAEYPQFYRQRARLAKLIRIRSQQRI